MDTTSKTLRTTDTAGRGRLRTRILLVTSLALAGALLAGGLASGQEDPPPIAVEVLSQNRAAFTDDVALQIRNKFDGRGNDVVNLPDASRIVTAEITIQPGAAFPWHTHPGPVLIHVADGDFVYTLAEDCVDRDYATGEALVDAGGDNVHTAHNPSEDAETTVIATFLGVPSEGALTVPVDEDEMDDLDDECDTDTPRP